jgi:N-acetyl-anhydromuramyl-L-alanine amidase AmpD
MRRILVLATILTSAAAAAPAQAAVQRPPVTWLKGEGNYTKSHRSAKAIRHIVVHVTEGRFWPSILWLKNERSHASSHYIVSRRGKIVQLVHESDIAWHAGNWNYNVSSVGVEHEGIVDDPAGFTAKQYEASARLAAYIARRAIMPITRRSFIGHGEVPNPFDPSRIGGADGHTDPGKYWNWGRYLKLVRKYAFPPRPKPIRLRVSSTTLYHNQAVRGSVPWRARVRGPVRRVDVFVDGRRVLRDLRAPFGGRWNTKRFANGKHVVELRAYGPRGSWTRKRLVVWVANPKPPAAPKLPKLALTARGVDRGATVNGSLRVEPTLTGGTIKIALLFLDGKRIDHDTSSPFGFSWNTTRVANGQHVLELRVRAADGRRAATRIPVVVDNAPPLAIVRQSLANGQTVSGSVPWQLEVTGRVARVELLVDGAVRATLTQAPFAWTWDTSTEAPGAHTLTARVAALDGKVVEQVVTVTVASP